jgi:sRNA-binding regulator protein Hfq
MQPRTSVGRDFQNSLVGQLIQRHQITTVYLRNRMSLRGRVLEIDPYVLLLDPLDGGPPHMVYKSAIVSVSGPPRRPPARGPMRGGPREGFRGPRDDRPRDDRPRPPRDDHDHAARPEGAPPEFRRPTPPSEP